MSTQSRSALVLAESVSKYIDGKRLNELVMTLARIGGREDGGVSRETLTEVDLQARKYLCDFAQELGCEIYQDQCANLFFRKNGTEELDPVVTGSHIDTQPIGGKYDGAYGVVAGLEVLAALNDAGITTRRPIEVAAWTNEEGGRFAPGAMGSSSFVYPELLEGYRNSLDSKGTSFGSELNRALQANQGAKDRALAAPVTAYVELHIEQGPILEQQECNLGIVEAVQGVRWFAVRCIGEMAHAGSTPMNSRKDAMSAAIAIVTRLHALASEFDLDGLRLTFGRWEVSPNSINTIPGLVEFSIDARCISDDVLQGFELRLEEIVSGYNWGGQVEVLRTFARAATHFPEAMVDIVTEACRATTDRHGLKDPMRLPSGAFHDAMYLAAHCPTAMIFVPSKGGISHNACEYTSPQELTYGAQALAYALVKLAS
ncbi:M20 family metallo-hydrolase [Pseudomonas aeruginosa]|uniref:M20 family metallo-hydrolase n=1 Tax=Pseudomonas aeruginosa TaxID=287 RepID=UPI00093767F5|nr:M20 family metallo-hydrolase [Pseudomonas aeruginosa]MCT5519281.1 M20 family metallo-hydrolase [Pseudomonas aeruginosa]MEE2515637.1 M20 family metallo-hydrolase [Pseudomonas aeruginosa]HEJ1327418.1 M20 family metallo-hydrolase [Pseudomonas aeruginosa]